MQDFADIFSEELKISPEEPLYVISIVSRLVHLPVWTLRELDKKDVIKPKRIGKKTRCYSLKDVKKLEYIHYLMEKKHVNISGIKIILEMEHKE
ncbi:MAG: MerR family transcriptional regulator [Candidatus Omnitrophota bacterium]|nr:MerR family transcriptional regulator [Candidatus Omnitrophota bacterium]